MDDRVLLLQLERAQERLEDRVESLAETELYEDIVTDIKDCFDADLGDLDSRIQGLEERQKEILDRLKALTKTCLELVAIVAQPAEPARQGGGGQDAQHDPGDQSEQH